MLENPSTGNVTHIVMAAPDGYQKKFWTGEMLDRWPVFVGDDRRARKVPAGVAKIIVREFRERMPLVRWAARSV